MKALLGGALACAGGLVASHEVVAADAAPASRPAPAVSDAQPVAPSAAPASPAVPVAAPAPEVGPGGAGQDGGAAAVTPRLTLADPRALAEKRNPLVRRAHAERMSVASAEVGASLLLPANPVLAVGAGPRRETDMGRTLSGTQLSAHIEQTLEIAGQRGTRRDVVARQVEAADWREQVARAEMRARVRAAYVGAQIAEAQLRSVGRRLDLVRRLVDGVRTRVETGASSDVEFELARVERGRALRQQIAAQLSVKEAYAELGVLLGEPAGTTFDLATPLHQPPVHAAPLGVMIDRARTYRAELKTLTASRKALDAELVRLRREVVPNPTLFVDFQRDLPGQTYVGGGIALPLPLWRRAQGERAIVRAEQSRLDEETDIAGREIAAEVEQAYRAYGAHGEMVRVLEDDILPAAESAVDLITEGWRAGKFDLFRVIQASREASDARQNHLQTLGELWNAAIALDRATGAS